jgi:hypothetical protein
MSISAISSTGPAMNTQSWQVLARQRQQDFQNLANALKSGDLGGARQSCSDLQALASSNSSGSPAPPSGTGPVQQDFATLGQDLSSGNLSQAQKDLTQMKNDLQSAFAQNGGSSPLRHHHGHGHHPEAADSSAQQSSTTTGPFLANTTSSLSQYASTNSTNSGSMASSLLDLVA